LLDCTSILLNTSKQDLLGRCNSSSSSSSNSSSSKRPAAIATATALAIASRYWARDLEVVNTAFASKVGLELTGLPQGLAGTVASRLDLVCRNYMLLDRSSLAGLEAALGLQAPEALVAG
jgi:hypothetical protein